MAVVNEEKDPLEKLTFNMYSSIEKTIAIMSGKGGVGKSSVTSLIAVGLQKKGYKVGILDADITGPSIPRIFGINNRKAEVAEIGMYPEATASGIQIISINLFLDKQETPVIWRGPLLANMVKQFYTDVVWGDLDYLLIDLPPGTGDVPLTLMQSVPLDGLIIVSSPQDLVKMIVDKSINMARILGVPILGLVENMSYFECPKCKEKTNVFGESRIEEIAKDMNIKIIAKLPIDPILAKLCDEGKIESYDKYIVLDDERESNN